MDVINPLSLLEVTMGEDVNEDNDCIIIDDEEIQNDETVNHLNNVSQGEKVEVEIDPLLFAPSDSYNHGKESDMTALWVTTNINNLAISTPAEVGFRNMKYNNIYEVLNEKLHCTICLDHVGCDIRIHQSSIEHPVLKVLVCEKCAINYRTVHFVRNEKGKEISCRWCGKSTFEDEPRLLTCQQCPFSFCELCLLNNFTEYIEPQFPWTCFVCCNMRMLWSARATFWAMQNLKNILLSNPENALANIKGDISLCCKEDKRRKKKKLPMNSDGGNTVHSFDLDQLVPPHLLDGSCNSLNFEQPQPLSLNTFAVVKCYPGAKHLKIIKSKPKPKPTARSKSRSTSQRQKRQHSSNQLKNSVPAMPEPSPKGLMPVKTSTNPLKQHWLRGKLIGYMKDFDQLRKTLEEIEQSLDFEENDNKTGDKINAITTLFSLHSDLLNNCRVNLLNEWKERKARAFLENYSTNVHENNEPINSNDAFNSFSGLVKKRTVSKVRSRKKQNPKKPKSSVNHKQHDEVNLVDTNDYFIKDCFVKLQKLKMPLPIVDKECFIKLEKIDIANGH